MTGIEVVVFNYKYEHWLPASLEAISAQSLSPARVTVSDDCSPPPHGDAFTALAAQFPWAKFVQTERNLGAVEHMRLRTGQVKAPYYLLLSADDLLIDMDFLRDAVDLLERNKDVVAVYGRYHTINTMGQLTSLAPRSTEPFSYFKGAAMRDMLALSNVVPAVCTVVRNSVHQLVPPFPIDNPLTHDWCQWYTMTLHGDFIRLNRPVLHYRVHDASLSQSTARAARYAAEINNGYEQLVQWPGLSAHDKAMLRRGKVRTAVHYATIGQVPGILMSNSWRDIAAHDLVENFAHRTESVAHRWHQRLRGHLHGH